MRPHRIALVCVRSGLVNVGDVLAKVNGESVLDHWMSPTDANRRSARLQTCSALCAWRVFVCISAHASLICEYVFAFCWHRLTHAERPVVLSFRPFGKHLKSGSKLRPLSATTASVQISHPESKSTDFGFSDQESGSSARCYRLCGLFCLLYDYELE